MSDPHDADHAERTKLAAQLVAADRVAVWEDEFHVMHLRLDQEQYDDVRPVWAFPISRKADYVSFVNQKGKELALLASLKDLDKESRAVVERALEQHYFVPKIIRIDSIIETWGVSHWHVETDCGYASFEVIDRENIRTLPKGRLIIVDADENRYEVQDVSRLDAQSQTLIQSET